MVANTVTFAATTNPVSVDSTGAGLLAYTLAVPGRKDL